jgi:hypothetical protein
LTSERMIEGISLSTNQLLMLSISSTGGPNALVRSPAYALQLNSCVWRWLRDCHGQRET